MKKNRILIITGHFHPDNSADSYLLTELGEDLVKAGFKVDILTKQPSYYTNIIVPRKEIFKGMSIERIESTRFNRQNLLLRLLDDIVYLISLIKNSLKYNQDIILVNTMPILMPFVVYFLNLIRNQKYVIINYEVLPELANKVSILGKYNPLYIIYNWFITKTLKNASYVVSIGKDMKEILKKKVDDNKIVIIPNWADSQKFFPENANVFRTKNKLNNNFIVQYSGNIGRTIDIESIINVAKRLKNHKKIKLVFVGMGIKLKQLEYYIKRYNLNNIILLPYQNKEYLNMSLNSADVSLVIIKKGCEGLVVPSKIYPSMACGKPIIGFLDKKSDTATSILTARAGFVINNSKELADKIIYLFNNKNKRIEMGHNSLKYFLANYERKLSTQKYIALLKSL